MHDFQAVLRNFNVTYSIYGASFMFTIACFTSTDVYKSLI